MHTPHSRRKFLGYSAAGVATPMVLQLNGIAAAGAQASTDYRALVCVFLYGGNDNYNTFIPDDDDGYKMYKEFRGSLARPTSDILSVGPEVNFNGASSVGFAKELSRLHDLFGNGDLALVNNVGSMIAPLEKATWDSNPSLVPPSLGSHNDQQSFWQSGLPEGATSGWGGRLGDLINDRLLDNGANPTFTCTSAAGNAVLMTGKRTKQFQVSTEGPTVLDTGVFKYANSMDAALDKMLRTQAPGLFPSTYSAVSKRALESSDQLVAELAKVSNNYDIGGQFTQETELSKQLEMVARMIVAGRDYLGLKRQVFFVGMGGFDTHNDLAEVHPALLSVVDDAMASFYQTTVDLKIENSVTTFTGSDFGRTLSINDNGSDHGWGSTHMVMGGAVNGNKAFGTTPTIALDGPDSTGRGRLLPTTSVDQYGATLAQWMGAAPSELSAIFPNLARFDSNDLGFMKM